MTVSPLLILLDGLSQRYDFPRPISLLAAAAAQTLSGNSPDLLRRLWERALAVRRLLPVLSIKRIFLLTKGVHRYPMGPLGVR